MDQVRADGHWRLIHAIIRELETSGGQIGVRFQGQADTGGIRDTVEYLGHAASPPTGWELMNGSVNTMTLVRTRRSSLVIPVVVLVAAIGLLTTLTATPGSAATLPSGSTPAQHGVNVYVTDNCQSTTVWQTYATNEMKGIKSLGANAVAIAFPFYTAGINANSVFTADQCNGAEQSPSPTRIGVLVHWAQLEGLHVLLRPLLNQSSLGNTWRGELQPTNRPDWFNSYSSMMAPYLRMAQTDKVTSFTISLELASLTKATEWSSVISQARSLYKGQLVFATSWRASPSNGAGEVHTGTSVGIDAYPGLPSSYTSSSSVAKLVSGWNTFLGQHHFGTADSKVTIDEVGIDATDGAYQTPYEYVSGPFDQKIQANWFTAACQFSKDHKLGGIYFWGPQFNYNSGKLMTSPQSSQPTELQPSAQTAIKTCFK